MRLAVMVIVVFGLGVVSSSPSAGDTRYVPDDSPTIQGCVDMVADGDTVVVRSGTYFENIKLIGKSIWLVGEEGAEATIIDGSIPSNSDSASVVLYSTGGVPGGISGGIKGFTLRGGSGTKGVMNPLGWYGGGIVCNNTEGGGSACFDGSHPIIEDNIIVDNHVSDPSQLSQGGGLKCYYSSPTVRNNTFKLNSADHAGGGASIRFSCALFEGNRLEGNSCLLYHGGAMAVEHMSDCTVSGNVFAGNSSGNQAGAIDVYLAQPVISGNTFVGNSALSWQAGGINCRNNANAQISNNIIVSSPSGKGVKCEGASPTFTCNDIWNNAGGDGICGVNGGGNFSSDPLFCGEAGGDYRLSPESPCAAALSPAGCGLVGALPVGCGPEAVQATLDIDPNTLNLKSEGEDLTGYIELPCAPSGCQLPAADDFSDGNDDGWTHNCVHTSCNYWIEDGVYYVQAGAGGAALSTFDATEGCSDYILDVDVKESTGPDRQVFFRDVSVPGDDRNYLLNIRSWELTLERRCGPGGTAGPDTMLANPRGSFPFGSWYHVRIVCIGGHIQVYVDGTKYIDVVDPDPILAGPVGVWGHTNQTAMFDNVSVTPVNGSCPPAGWHDPADIDVSTVMLNDAVPAELCPTSVGDYDMNGIPDRMVKFSRSALIAVLAGGDGPTLWLEQTRGDAPPVKHGEQFNLIVTGQLSGGTPFHGTDEIRVINPSGCSGSNPELEVFPTPIRGNARINYELAAGGAVTLRVYDAAGRLVRTLVAGTKPAGSHDVTWDHRTDDGRRVGSGIYFVRLEQHSGTLSQKLLVVE